VDQQDEFFLNEKVGQDKNFIEDQNDELASILLDENINAIDKMRRLLEKESEVYVELSERAEEISEAIEHTPMSHHLPEELFFGSHILASLFAGFGFFRATKAFFEEEKNLFTQGTKLAYAGTVFILVILAIFLTDAAPALGLATAALGFLMSASFLILYFKNARSYSLLEAQYIKEMDQLDQQTKFDLNQLDGLSTDDVDFDQKMETFYRRHVAREQLYTELMCLKNQTMALKTKLNRVALYRAYSIFTASIGLAGAIVLIAAASVAGPILLYISFGLGLMAAIYGVGRFIHRHFELKKEEVHVPTDSQVAAADESEMSKSETCEAGDSEVMTNPSLERLAEMKPDEESFHSMSEEETKAAVENTQPIEVAREGKQDEEEREGESTKP
jgi:ABC-type multidrug transport system fused ATPase/permease subunit